MKKVAEALEKLPLLPLNTELLKNKNKNIAKMTGADATVPVPHANNTARALVPTLVLATGYRCNSVATAGTTAGGGDVRIGTDENAVSACPDKRRTPLTSADSGVVHMEARGLEPLTFSMPLGEHSVVSAVPTGLTTLPVNACTPACTPNEETCKAAAAGGADADFADAMKMIATLPLSKAEKAEAVRRLLTGGGTE